MRYVLMKHDRDLIKGHIFLLVLVILLVALVLERLYEGLHVSLGGSGGGLVPKPELPDEGPELPGAQGHGEHGERLLELRGLDRAGQVSQGHLLALLACWEEVLHLVRNNNNQIWVL